MKAVFRLQHDEARRRALQCVSDAPAGYTVTVAPPRRSLSQNDKFHAICTDLERSGATWRGEPMDKDAWKVLLVSGHAVATKREARVTVGIEGELVNLRESTAAMSKERGSSLIEYAQAFAAMHGVELGTA